MSNPSNAHDRRRYAILILGMLGILVAALDASRPRQELRAAQPDPKKEHIRVYLWEAPAFKFYRRKDFTGAPAIEVNERGGFVDGVQVCSWPGGRYDQTDEANMMLGYLTVGTSTVRPCPDGFPVLSVWGDNGLGGAAQLIAVSARHGLTIEVRFQGKPFYLDLRSLPGAPAKERDDLYGKRPNGTVSWDFNPSEEAVARADAKWQARIWSDQTFVRFLRDVQACITSSRAPDCLLPYLTDPMDAVDVTDGQLQQAPTPREFVDIVWRRVQDDGHRRWDDLRSCMSSKVMAAYEKNARLDGENGWSCSIRKTKAGWKLWSLSLNPD